MTNYSRFMTLNSRLHSHALLKGKSGTVGDNEEFEPLVKYLGETKVNFESDVLPSLAAWHLELPDMKNIKHTLIKM